MRAYPLRLSVVLLLMIASIATGIVQPARAFSNGPGPLRHGLQQVGALRPTAPLPAVVLSSYDYLPNQSELTTALKQGGFNDIKLVNVDTEIPNGVDAFREYTLQTEKFSEAYLSLIATTLPSYVTANFYFTRMENILTTDVSGSEVWDVADQVGLTRANLYLIHYGDGTISYIYLLRQGMVVTGVEINGFTSDGVFFRQKDVLDLTRDLIVQRQSAAPSVNSDLLYAEQHSDADAAAQAWQGASWQTSAPRTAASVDDPSAEIGLRNKWGTLNDSENIATLVQRGEVYEIGAVVAEPSGWTSAAYGLIIGNDWTYAQYPYDFVGGRYLQSGTYSITWYAFNGKGESTVLANDSFTVK